MRHANSLSSLLLLAILLIGGFIIFQGEGGIRTYTHTGGSATACPPQPASLTMQISPPLDTLPSGQERSYRLIIQNPMDTSTRVQIHTTTLHPDVSDVRIQTSSGRVTKTAFSLPEGVSEGICTPSQETLLLTLRGSLPPLLPQLEDEVRIQACYTVNASTVAPLCALPPGSVYDPTESICTPGPQQVRPARVPLSLNRIEDLILIQDTTQASKENTLTAGFRLVFSNTGGGIPFTYTQEDTAPIATCTPQSSQVIRKSPAILIEGTLSGRPITCTPTLTLSKKAEQTDQGLIGSEYSTNCTAKIPRIIQPSRLVLTITYAYAYEPPITRMPFTLIH